MRIKSAVKMCIVGMVLLLMVQGVQAETDWFNEGNKMFADGYFEQAIENYEKAVEIEPNNDNAWSNMGVSYQMLNQQNKARPCFNRALEIAPNCADHWWGKGFGLDFCSRSAWPVRQHNSILRHGPGNQPRQCRSIFQESCPGNSW